MKLKWLTTVFGMLIVGYSFSALPFKKRIDKAFDALNAFNYFESRKQFLLAEKKCPSLANFGLSIIFYRSDNPYHSLDSAYARINAAISLHDLANKTELDKMQFYMVSKDSMFILKSVIERLALNKSIGSADISQLNHYIETYSDSKGVQEVIRKRDSLAFLITLKENSSDGYQQYISMYQGSHLIYEARARYEKALYDESVFDGKESSYASFVEAYPKSPHVKDAMRKIYHLATKNSADPEIYHQFILKYPGNMFTEDAWQRIYELHLADYTVESLQLFKEKYPDYPHMDQFDEELRLSREILLPFKEGELYGLIDITGNVVLDPRYDFIGKFHEGIAIVSKNGKLGYITKSGEELIPPFYDDAENFHNNLAVVGEEGKYGVINRSGSMVVPLMYHEISDFSEGCAVAFDGNKFGYINRSGTPVIPFQFQSAGEFRNGKAICQRDDFFGLINDSGLIIIPFKYDAIEWFSSEVVKVVINNKSGLISTGGDSLTPINYDEIGPLFENRAVVTMNGKMGFVDGYGKLVLPLRYTAGKDVLTRSRFVGRFAIVKDKHKYGIVDSAGSLVIPYRYEELSGMTDSVVAFRQKSLWGVISLDGGRIILPAKYDQVITFSGERAIAVVKGKFGMVDFKGKTVVPFRYESLLPLKSGLIIGRKSGKIGVIDISNGEILPFEFDQFSEKEEGYIEFSAPAKTIWLDVLNRRIIDKT